MIPAVMGHEYTKPMTNRVYRELYHAVMITPIFLLSNRALCTV